MAAASGMDWVPSVLQLATAGGFSALVWYLVVKHIPFIESNHREERTEWRDAGTEERAEFRKTIVGITTDTSELMKETIAVLQAFKEHPKE